jgi:archaellum component FlaF (FlaF/FlaG flagellin family)
VSGAFKLRLTQFFTTGDVMNLRKSNEIYVGKMISGLYAISIICLFGIGCNFAQMKETRVQTKDSKDITKTKDSKNKVETQEKTLIGRWKSDVATVEIRDDGKMTINGQSFNYRVNGQTMTISNNQETINFLFQLDGDTLTVNVQGREIVYKRLNNQRNDDEETANNGGSNPQELVGKWCYMSNVQANNGGRMSNTCFTLNADGTYDYYSETNSSNPYGGTSSQDSDAGRWSATATTIISRSNSGQTRTFNLEKRNHPKTNDPMLVIDGQPFVTAYQKEPW